MLGGEGRGGSFVYYFGTWRELNLGDGLEKVGQMPYMKETLPVALHCFQNSFLPVGYESHDGLEAVHSHAAQDSEVDSTNPGPDIPRGESGCSPDVREQGVLGKAVDDRAIHVPGFGPMSRKVSAIEEATLISLLTRSGTVLRSWWVCRLEVLDKDCLFSKIGSWRGSSVSSEIGTADV